MTDTGIHRDPVGRRARCVPAALVLCLCLMAGSALAETAPAARTWFVSGAELAKLLQGMQFAFDLGFALLQGEVVVGIRHGVGPEGNAAMIAVTVTAGPWAGCRE